MALETKKRGCKKIDMENNEPHGDHSAKRQRGVNYTEQEKQLLLNLVFQEKHIIECKKTDAVTWREKEASWKRITSSFNSISPNQNLRNMDSLKKLYENQKKQVRKDVAKEKASFTRTGGGEGYVVKDPSTELTLAIMNKKTVLGLENNFDCDASNVPLETPEYIQSNNVPLETAEYIQSNNVPLETAEYIQSNFPLQTEETCEPERIIIEVEEPCEETEDHSDKSWATYTPSMIKRPVHSKLQVVNPVSPHVETSGAGLTISTNDMTSPNAAFRKWTSRRRPTSSALPSSTITKQYNDLSQIKLEIANLELQVLKKTTNKKEEREEVEFLLRKRSLELDIQIKQEILERIKALPPKDIFKYLGSEILNKK